MSIKEVRTINTIRISLKAARVNAGLSQREAAARLGICRETLGNYEAGITTPDWDVVKRIEEVYGLSAENIFLIEITLKA